MTESAVAGRAALREARYEDYAGIEALKSRYHLGPSTEAEWRHLYEDNPFLAKLAGPWPLGWVLEADGGAAEAIVGHLGNLPLEYELNGRRLVAASAYSWVVDQEYRSRSRELALEFFAQAHVDLFLNTTATWPSGRAFEKLGARKPPVESYDWTAFWVLEHPEFISSLLRKKRIPLAKALSYPLAGMMLGAEAVRRRDRARPRASGRIEACSAFDERFDRFWDALRARGNRLLCARDSASLHWHYGAALRSDQAWLYAVEGAAGLTAYGIFLRQDNPEIGLRRARLVDFQSLEQRSGVLSEMLSHGLARCRQEAVHTLEVIGFGTERKREIERRAPYRRQLPSWMFWYKARDEALARELENPDFWDPCSYDGDAAF